MANKRMFSKDVVETDKFLSMPVTARELYFHLNMNADDEGFVSSPKTIQKICGASDDDIRILAVKEFVIVYYDGIVVISDWNINNYLQNDRVKKTVYSQHSKALSIKNKKYYPKVNTTLPDWIEKVSEMYTNCIQDGYSLDTQYRLDQSSVDNNSLDNNIIDVIKYMINDAKVKHIEAKTYSDNVLSKAEQLLCNTLSNNLSLVSKDNEKLIIELYLEALEMLSDDSKYVREPQAYLNGILANKINEKIINDNFNKRRENEQNN